MFYFKGVRRVYQRLLATRRLTSLTVTTVMVGLLLSPALASSAPDAASTPVTLTGVFSIIWGDPTPGVSDLPSTNYSLVDDKGQVYELTLDPRLSSRLPNIFAKRITVSGSLSQSRAASGAIRQTIVVDSIHTADGKAEIAPTVTGNHPFLSILCKFSDIATEPRTTSFFINQYGTTKPGFNNYIQEMSFNQANLDNSSATGWAVLPHPHDYYVTGSGSSSGYLNGLAQDCANASGRIDLSTYYGLNFMFNGQLGNYAWGGSVFLQNNGTSLFKRATWMPYWGESNTFGWREHGVLAHEMSHAFGSLHSGSSIGYQYGSVWDVVSDPQAHCSGAAIDATYGCVGQGIVSYNRDTMGFIPPGRKVIYAPSSGTQTYSLDFLSLTTASSSSSKYEIVVPTVANPNTRYYTVEARRQESYDSKLPLAQAVIIHDVDTTRGGGDPNAPIAYLFPPPGAPHDSPRGPGGDPGTGDAGANWPIGQTLMDNTNKIQIKVVAATSTGFTIQVSPLLVPFVVTQGTDDSTGQTTNSLSWAINQTVAGSPTIQLIGFQLPANANNTVKITGSLPPVPAGVIIQGKDCSDTINPRITLDGNGTATRFNLGLGNITLMGLNIRGFAGPQLGINALGHKGVKIFCTSVQK